MDSEVVEPFVSVDPVGSAEPVEPVEPDAVPAAGPGVEIEAAERVS